MAESRLWKPLKIAGFEVKHRIGMPALSRFRGTDDHTATAMMKEYYSQRSRIPWYFDHHRSRPLFRLAAAAIPTRQAFGARIKS